MVSDVDGAAVPTDRRRGGLSSWMYLLTVFLWIPIFLAIPLRLLYFLPPLLLKKSRLSRRGGHCYVNHLLAVNARAVAYFSGYPREQMGWALESGVPGADRLSTTSWASRVILPLTGPNTPDKPGTVGHQPIKSGTTSPLRLTWRLLRGIIYRGHRYWKIR